MPARQQTFLFLHQRRHSSCVDPYAAARLAAKTDPTRAAVEMLAALTGHKISPLELAGQDLVDHSRRLAARDDRVHAGRIGQLHRPQLGVHASGADRRTRLAGHALHGGVDPFDYGNHLRFFSAPPCAFWRPGSLS